MADAKADDSDASFMTAALGLAARGLGQVWPNPAVGCIIVSNGRVVGRGWTQPGGRPHAESEALRRADMASRGASAYVTFEPCAHHGVTPPCADALCDAGVARAVVALEDPDPRVAGHGLGRLRDGGVEVVTGVCADAARALNAGFLSRVTRGRPLVTLKAATTLDGRIAVRSGDSRWITGAAARARVHLMRAECDAVMIGVGTAIADDPELTCRLPGLGGRSPIRILVDGRLRMPLTHKLMATADRVPTWVVAADGCDRERQEAVTDRGVVLIMVPAAGGQPDMKAAFAALGERGLTRVLVEGGSHLSAALLRAGLVDRLAWFRSPTFIGDDGWPAVRALGVERLDAMPAFRRLSVTELGDDLLETYALRS